MTTHRFPPDVAPRPRRRGIRILAGSAIVSWILVLMAWFFQGALATAIWIFAYGLDIGLRAIALALSAAWFALLLWRRRWPAAAGVLAGIAAVMAIVFLVPWLEVYPRAWFALNHGAFVAAEAEARSGGYGDALDDYMGAELPGNLRAISVGGRLVTVYGWTGDSESIQGPCGDAPVLFAPAWMGIPDGAIGFVHLACETPPADLILDGYADPMTPRIPLGDGWWWAD